MKKSILILLGLIIAPIGAYAVAQVPVGGTAPLTPTPYDDGTPAPVLLPKGCSAGQGMGVGSVNGSTTLCSACKVGYYAPNLTTTCTQCPSNTTTRSTGSTSASDCICPAGYGKTNILGYAGNNVCGDCNYGYYNDGTSADCIACPAGKTTTKWGATSVSDCK